MSAVITPQRTPKPPKVFAKGEKNEATKKEVDHMCHRVKIPDIEDKWFSFRILWAFTGPGFLMSIAYLDPGNIESDLRSGAVAKYKLIWVLLLAHVLGLLLQRLSARLGIVSGMHLAEVAHEYYPRVPRLILWILVEVAIVGADMQEVIGTSIAIYLISNTVIPLWAGVLITICDTFTFMFFDRYGVRKFEFFFCFLISVMAVTFGYEFFTTQPNLGEVAKGTFIPWCSNCGSDEFQMAIGVVGAVIMPHNLYLHSALVRSRVVDRSKKNQVQIANKYFFIESAIALLCSFIINLFVVSVFGKGFHGKTNGDIYDTCQQPGNDMPSHYRSVFLNDTEPAESDIYHSGILLGCTYGVGALYVWAVGILAAGQSSTMTGTYAGQFVMEGFIQIRMIRWKRILLTRSIAILPTLIVTIFSRGVGYITSMNDILNCVQMIQLPFALLPVLTFTSNKQIMGEFACSRLQKVFSVCISAVVIAINMYFLYEQISATVGTEWYVLTPLGIFVAIYAAFVAYFAYYCITSMNIVKPIKWKCLPQPDYNKFDQPWTEDEKDGKLSSMSDIYTIE